MPGRCGGSFDAASGENSLPNSCRYFAGICRFGSTGGLVFKAFSILARLIACRAVVVLFPFFRSCWYSAMNTEADTSCAARITLTLSGSFCPTRRIVIFA